MVLEHSFVDLIGAIAGALAISISLYLQVLRTSVYSGVHILMLYVFGVLLLLLNLEPVLAGSGYWALIRFILYCSVLAAEAVIVYHAQETDFEWYENIKTKIREF